MLGAILCGGKGKRLRPLTEDTPKPLVELKQGYTVLDRQLLDFSATDIDKVILITGYLGEKIEERFGDEHYGLDIEYMHEEAPSGTLNALRAGLEQAGEDVLVRNGDVVADVNLSKMMKTHYASELMATMFITQMRSPYGIVEITNGRVKSFKEKPLLNYHINGGVYCLSHSVLELFSGFTEGEVENTVFPILAETEQMGYYEEGLQLWKSIDTLKDLEEVRSEYASRTDKPWGHEKVLISTDKYLTKELFLFEGFSTSYHYHEHKDETMYVVEGAGYVEFEDHTQPLKKNESVRVEPNTPHRIGATENMTLYEVSTPHLDDTVRIKDYYRAR